MSVIRLIDESEQNKDWRRTEESIGENNRSKLDRWMQRTRKRKKWSSRECLRRKIEPQRAEQKWAEHSPLSPASRWSKLLRISSACRFCKESFGYPPTPSHVPQTAKSQNQLEDRGFSPWLPRIEGSRSGACNEQQKEQSHAGARAVWKSGAILSLDRKLCEKVRQLCR